MTSYIVGPEVIIHLTVDFVNPLESFSICIGGLDMLFIFI